MRKCGFIGGLDKEKKDVCVGGMIGGRVWEAAWTSTERRVRLPSVLAPVS